MEVHLALLIDAATIDGSGKLNIIGILDRISTVAFPTRYASFTSTSTASPRRR